MRRRCVGRVGRVVLFVTLGVAACSSGEIEIGSARVWVDIGDGGIESDSGSSSDSGADSDSEADSIEAG